MPKFGNVLYAPDHLIRESGNINEYLKGNAEKYYLFLTPPEFMDEPDRLETYENGVLKSVREYSRYRGRSRHVKFTISVLHFAHARLFLVARNTTVFTFLPTLCFANALFRRLRGGRTVFWVFDYYGGVFPIYDGIADFYVGRLPIVLFLTEAMRSAYEKRLGRKSWQEWRVVSLGTKFLPMERKPQDGLIGFIGGLRPGQGVENLIDFVAADPSLRLEIIGAGVPTYAAALRERAAASNGAERISFLGPILDEKPLVKITLRWQMAAAIYDGSAHITYADPGKIKLYAQIGVPSITTKLNAIWKTVAQTGAGEVIDDERGLAAAVSRIRSAPESYEKGCRDFCQLFEYHKLYDVGLDFLASEPR